MKHLSWRIVGAGLLWTLAGCVGLSGPGKTTTLGYDLSLLKERKAARPAAFPMHLAVAQAGAVRPEEALLEPLRARPKLFSRISLLPAAPETRDFNKEVDQRDPEGLLALAEQMGADAVLLVGGSIDADSSRTPLCLLDLTILGHYLVPSNRVHARASAVGALLSVPERRLVLTVDEQVEKRSLSPSVSRHESAEELARKARDALLASLAGKAIAEIEDRAGIGAGPEEAPRPSPPVPVSLSPPAPPSSSPVVYVVSDGFHMGLILPNGIENGEPRYAEIGLGERTWLMDRKWGWVTAVMSGIAHNDGVAIAELRNGRRELDAALDRQKRAWRVELSDKEWGLLLECLEKRLCLEEVLQDGEPFFKAVKTAEGYDLFNTCQQFVLNPLARAGKRTGSFLPRTTPAQERRLDRVFGPASKVK